MLAYPQYKLYFYASFIKKHVTSATTQIQRKAPRDDAAKLLDEAFRSSLHRLVEF
jgi:hypothetical protein